MRLRFGAIEGKRDEKNIVDFMGVASDRMCQNA